MLSFRFWSMDLLDKRKAEIPVIVIIVLKLTHTCLIHVDFICSSSLTIQSLFYCVFEAPPWPNKCEFLKYRLKMCSGKQIAVTHFDIHNQLLTFI